MKSQKKGARRRRPTWDGGAVRALREYLNLTQQGLSDELGVRQQTVSEWETGRYRPRGPSARLLTIVAERSGFVYGMDSEAENADDNGGIADAGKTNPESR